MTAGTLRIGDLPHHRLAGHRRLLPEAILRLPNRLDDQTLEPRLHLLGDVRQADALRVPRAPRSYETARFTFHTLSTPSTIVTRYLGD